MTSDDVSLASSRPAWRDWLALLLIVALAALLRLPGIGRDGMWSDECLTATWAAIPWRETLAAVSSNDNSPLYFILAKLPLALAGNGEASWRLLPAVLGILGVGAVFLAGRTILTRGAALTAAFLLAISPLHVHYSREARNYTLLILLVVLAFAAAGRVRRRGRAVDVVLLALLLAAAMYTHPLAAFAAGGILLAWGLCPLERRTVARLALAAVLAAVALLPWSPRVFRQGLRAQQSYAWHRPDFDREFPTQVPRSLAALSHGSLAPVRNRVADLLPSAWIGAALVAALGGLALARRRMLPDPAAPGRLLVAALAPLLALFVAATLGPPVYVVGRSDVFALPFLLLLVAAGTAVLPTRVRPLVALAFAGLAILPLQVLYTLDTRSQEKRIVATLSGARRPGEPVVATAFLPCLEHYGGLRPGVDLLGFPARSVLTAEWIDWRDHPPARWPAEAGALALNVAATARDAGAARVWVLRRREGVGDALVTAFDGALFPLGGTDLGYQGTEIRAYGVPLATPAR